MHSKLRKRFLNSPDLSIKVTSCEEFENHERKTLKKKTKSKLSVSENNVRLIGRKSIKRAHAEEYCPLKDRKYLALPIASSVGGKVRNMSTVVLNRSSTLRKLCNAL